MMKHRNSTLATAAFSMTLCCAAHASDAPADPCSLLAPADLSTVFRQSYDAAQKSVAPRPFANTVQGTDCTYKQSKGSGQLLFRIYFDPSPAAAADLFARLGGFFQPQTPMAGVGDKAYIDGQGGAHVLKGNVRFFLQGGHSSPNQLTALAQQIAGRL